MATLGFTENDRLLSEMRTSTPKREEYQQSDMSALFQTLNTGGAMWNRGNFERSAVDMAQYEGKEFTQDNLKKDLETKGYAPEVIDQTLMSNQGDWASAERRANYVRDVQTKERQVQENFSTAGMIAAGIPMALIDIDSIAISPMLAGANKLKKAMNLSSRMAKVAHHSATGAAISATSMLAYEATTGMYKDDSLINSAMIGAALGGSLGYLVERAVHAPSLNQTLDGEGKLLTKEESKVEQLTAANTEHAKITTLIDEVKATKLDQQTATKDLADSQQRDVGRERVDNRIGKEQRKQARDASRREWEDTKRPRDEASSELSGITKTLRELERGVTSTTKSIKALADEAIVRKTLTKEASPLKGQITKLSNQLKALGNSRSKASIATRETIGKKLDVLNKKLRTIEAKVTRSETRANKHPANPSEQLKRLLVDRDVTKVQASSASKVFKNAQKVRDEKKTAHKKASKEHDDFQLAVKKEEASASFETLSLQDKLARYDADLSPEGLKKLLEQRDLLSTDIAKMSNDDFNLKTLRGIQKNKQNYVDKLSKELDEIGKLNDFRQSDTFKKLPEWARKLVISPIEKLLNSDNAVVSGLASQLHSGTVHHGKINAMTAWVLRGMLDNRLNRMHKNLIYSHSQAKKEGYTGSMGDFESDVAANAYKVVGQMQRDLYTGISGDIVGLARMEAAKAKAGSVQRVHDTDNEWIKKATDNYLDYYEGIHQKGSELGMDAFKGSLGKAYIKRTYSKAKINGMGAEVAIQRITDAQEAFARSVNSEITPETMAIFRAKAEKAVNGTLDNSLRKEQITRSLGMAKQSTTSSLKQRGIDAFDDDLMDMLEDDIHGTSQLYALSVHGRMALKEKLGVDNDEQIESLITQSGATPKEVDNLRVLVETIKGTREVSKNPFDPFTRAVKMASTYTSAMHTMAFALPTITEVASIAKEFGWTKTMDKLVGNPKDIYQIYKNGTDSEKNTIELMVSYGDAHFGVKANRADVETSYDSVGRPQEFLDNLVHKEAVFGGLLPLTDMLRMATTSLSVDFMAGLSVASKISPVDEMRLQDMGFSKEDLPLIKERLQVNSAGRIGNTDRKTWGKLDDKITAGVMTMVERTILHPNGATLPKFMTNMNEGQFLPRVMFKFMRFPVESYERMLMRGVQEADSKQLMGLAGNIGMWTMILAAKDAIRPEDKQHYGEDDGYNQLMLDSLLYNSFTALPVAASDTVSGLLTGKNLTNDYRYSIGGAVSSDYQKLIGGRPTFSLPGYNVNIGEAVAPAMNVLKGLEEVNQE